MTHAVIGVDVGPTPGVVLLVPHAHAGVLATVLQCDRASLSWMVLNLADRFTSTTPTIAAERFVVSSRSARSSTSMAGQIARDQIGQLQALGLPMTLNTASTVKAWATDDRLAACELLEPTKAMPHARDAARHALYALCKAEHLLDPLSKRTR